MDDWDTILARAEKIIWQGRPFGAFKFRSRMFDPTVFGKAKEPDGFKVITDAPEVMRLIRDTQNQAITTDAP